MWGTSGVHSCPFSIHFYGDYAQLWPACPMLWSWLCTHYEHQLKIRSFFYQEQVVPSSESYPTRSYSLAKTTIFDAFFQVFLQQASKNSRFLGWLSNQKHVRSIEIAFTCLFLWHINVNSAIFVQSATRLVPRTYIFKKDQQTYQAILFHI